MTSIYPSTSPTNSTTSSANLMRISGMASGIDTDALVKSMVSNYQSKIDKANQAKQTLEWKQEAYRDIIKGVKGLQDYFDPLSSKYMLSGNSFNTNAVTSPDNAIVSGTVSSVAQVGTYTVNVQQLAEQAKISGSSLNSMIEVADLDVANWSGATIMLGATPIQLDDTITATNTNGTNLDEVVANINSKIAANSTLNGTVSASYVKDGTKSYIKLTSTNSIALTATASVANGSKDLGMISSINNGISSATKLSDLVIPTDLTDISFSLSYDVTTNTTPVSITASSTSTIKDLMDKVNSATGGAVTMSIDDTTGKISFQSKNNGSSSGVTIKNNSSNISNLGITIADSVVGITGTGKDALVDITAPGQSTVTTTQSSNKFTTNGVSYNLTSIGSASLTVASNSETVVSNVKKFIDDYNTIVSTINTKLTEKQDKGYTPLIDEQRTSMSDTQITAWETKAKVGILRKDDYLSSLMSQLRGTLYSPVYSTYDSGNSGTGKVSLSFGNYGAGAIGIETSTDYLDGGKLVIKDETKLKKAIENNMEDFKKLLIGSSSSTLDSNQTYINSKQYNEDGIFRRMDNIMRDYVASPGLGKEGTYSLSGYMNIFINKQYDYSSSGSSGKNTLPDQMYTKTLSVSKFQTQLMAAQTRYYAKFTALETAMSALNSQQSALSSMLGTGA